MPIAPCPGRRGGQLTSSSLWAGGGAPWRWGEGRSTVHAVHEHRRTLRSWWLADPVQDEAGPSGPGARPHPDPHEGHPWWQVMCLSGLDYFSTLGHQPAIAALAAGLLSPVATFVLVLVTLGAALPM